MSEQLTKEERVQDCCFSAGCTKPAMPGSVLCEEHYKALPKPMRGDIDDYEYDVHDDIY